MFSQVFVCPQGGDVGLYTRVFLSGGLCLGAVSVEGESLSRETPPRMVKSGRHASYWNVFLFFLYFYFRVS